MLRIGMLLLASCALCGASAVANQAPQADVQSTHSAAAFASLERRAAALSHPRRHAKTNSLDFTDYSPSGFKQLIAAHRTLLAELARIDRTALPHDSQVTYDLIQWDAQRMIDREPFPWLQFPYTPYELLFRGPNPVLTGFVFRTDADADAYLRLAAKYPAATASMAELIAEQKNNGIYLQRDVAAKVRQIIADYAQPPEKSFAWPTDERLSALSRRAAARLRRSLTTLIEREINPAIRALAEQFDESYQARAPQRYGVAQYPGGKDYYRMLVRYRLTIEKTPEELYEQSQAELDRIESDLQSLRAEMGYFGARASFDAQLAQDPRFAAKTADDVERVYLDYMSRIDPFMPKLFCRKPLFGYGVRRATPEQEAALTYGYADIQTQPVPLGMYYYNGSNLEHRSLLPAQALIYHELAPGHYWQAATHMLSKRASAYPRANNAFAEAWGDFAQQLAYEQGVFRTPGERYGRRLFNAMFHARALADIGINYFGRDFDWGLKVLERYTFESQLQNRSSLARDASDWPAQILPYSFGSQELLRLREKARAALGERFSEPRFYDAVLSSGELPFPVLEKHLDWFIEQEQAGGAAGICQ